MRAALTIGHNDVRRFLLDKTGYIWLFVVPLAFVFFMGMAFRAPGAPSTPNPAVAIENLDQGSLGALVAESFAAHGFRVIDEPDSARVIRIPEDFSSRLRDKKPVKVALIKKDGAGQEAAAMVELRLVRYLIKLNAAMVAQANANALGNGGVDEEALQNALQAPRIVDVETRFAGRRPIPSGYNQSLPGILVMFVLMNLLIFGGSSLAEERQTGVLKRLAVCPVGRRGLVMGKIYGRFLLGVVQITFMLLAGALLFKVSIAHVLAGVVATLTIYAWACASLGVLIGAFSRNPDKVIGLCVLTSLIMAALGGCWWPLEIVPDTMRTVAHIFPTAWAMDAMHHLISFGGSVTEVGKELVVLAGFAAAANLAAVKLLRY